MPLSAQRQRALAVYAQVQDKIPSEWRLTDQSLLARAWVFPEDVDPSTVESDVGHVFANCGIMTARELELTQKDTAELAQLISTRALTSFEVTTAFCKAAAIAQQLYRCCTELFFDEALARAKELDNILNHTGKTVGLLHGVPVSLKDHVHKKGIRSTMGMMSLLDHVAESSSPLVTALEEQGAVIFVKTNNPAALMSAETVNHIFGRAQNPRNRTKGVGGSSGGEGALIAAHGSCLGVGSDIAGSIRMPAAMCGVYGFKPSPWRLPIAGVASCACGGEFVAPVLGPLASSVAGIELFMKAVILSEPWKVDSTCYRFPWREVTVDRPLKFGIIRENGLVRPHPPVSRVLEEAAAKLQQAGHQVVEFDVGDMHVRAEELRTAFFRADGAALLSEYLLQDETPFSTLEFGKQEDVLEVKDLLKKHWTAVELRDEYLRRWQALALDALICSTASHAAPDPDAYNDTSNTVPFNLMQFCAMAIPFGHVNEQDMHLTQEYVQYEPHAHYQYRTGLSKRDADRVNHETYLDEKKRRSMIGLPLSIQVVCQPHRDEECIAISRTVDKVLKK